MIKRKSILFICSRNKRRSKTAEMIFKENPNVNVKSAGTSKVAERKVSQELINWADEIFVMEKKHKEHIQRKFGRIEKEMIILNIPDEYQYMDSELIEELKATVYLR